MPEILQTLFFRTRCRTSEVLNNYRHSRQYFQTWKDVRDTTSGEWCVFHCSVVAGNGPGGVSEPHRIQRISEAVPQHHLWTTSYWRSARSESNTCVYYRLLFAEEW